MREGTHYRRRPLDPTPRQLEVLRARFRHGSRKEAAAALGIADVTARGHTTALLARIGATNAEEAAYLLWLRDLWGDGIPDPAGTAAADGPAVSPNGCTTATASVECRAPLGRVNRETPGRRAMSADVLAGRGSDR